MKIRSFITWLYRKFGRHSFRTRQVLQQFGYIVYPISRNAIYISMHKCWKRGLLSRQRFYGNSYTYRLTKWGVRYVEEGRYYRDDAIRSKLLTYILQYGDEDDKVWAEAVLVPRLLQRFFPGRCAQLINPRIDLPNAMVNAADRLRMRIQSEAIEPNDEFIIDCHTDLTVLYQTATLMFQLHPDFDIGFAVKKLKRRLKDVVIEVASYDPPEETVIRGLGQSGRMRAYSSSEPRFEERPNESDWIKLLEVMAKLDKFEPVLQER